MARYEQHGGLTRVYVTCFVAVITRKWSFDDQCSHEQTAFCSYVLGQIALYLQKAICGKNKTSLVQYGCFLVSGAKVVQFSEHKNVHTTHFLFVFKLLFEKREGEFLATTIWPLATKNLYLIASWHPY